MAALTMSEPPTSATSRAAYLRKSPPRCGGCCGSPGAGAVLRDAVGSALFACRTHPRTTSVSFATRARDSGLAGGAVGCELVCGNVIRLPRGRSRPSAASLSSRVGQYELAALAASQQQEG